MDGDASAMELLFTVDSSLTSLQLASILEAGLTLVLYQRGQIPLPYQQLEKSALQLMMEQGKQNTENIVNGLLDTMESVTFGSSFAKEVNPRARMCFMIQERRKRALMQKLEKQRKLSLAVESKAFNAIKPALMVLESLVVDAFRMKGSLLSPFSLGDPKEIVTVALVLGPSVYCPKEIFLFDLPSQQMLDGSTGCSKLLPEQFQSTVLRQFYKKLITNPDLLDFTSRPLSTTYTHICVISTGDLDFILSDKNPNYRNVARLPSIPPCILDSLITSGLLISGAESMEGSNPIRPLSSFSRKAKNKCFRVKIHQNRFFEQGSIESTTSDNNSFSSDTLFDSNSFSCYQIPLRFKGVPCKNKGL